MLKYRKNGLICSILVTLCDLSSIKLLSKYLRILKLLSCPICCEYITNIQDLKFFYLVYKNTEGAHILI